MSEMNTITAAEDLLARMVVTCQQDISKKFILENMDKFRSAIIFQGLIKRNILEGSTNQEMYDLYCKVASDMDIEPISNIDFSRTLSKYYGYRPHSVKVDGRTKRVFEYTGIERNDKDSLDAVQSMTYYLTHIIKKDDVIGQRNVDVYEKYDSWCKDNFLPVGSKITFSRMTCTIHDVKVRSMKVKGTQTNIRVYVEKDGDDNGDNSPSQAGLG